MQRHPHRKHHNASRVLILTCICPLSALAEDQIVPNEYIPVEEEIAALDPAVLEAEGAVIGRIAIKSHNIFNLDDPLENRWLYRIANKLHIVTKPNVIKSQLLLEEGEPFSVRLADESERILRRNSYLREADIIPTNYENGVVDLAVDTIDVWTLTPEVSLGRKGGENRFGIGLLEQNLLGRGIQVGAVYKSTVDRKTMRFDFADNNFLHDRYRIAATYSSNSDGIIRNFQFAKPFLALDQRRGGNVHFGNGQQIDSLYDLGEVVAEYTNRFQAHQAMLGWSKGLRDGWVTRYVAGVNYQSNEFNLTDDDTLPVMILPEDREFLYPFIGFELIEDKYETAVNFDQIHRTEDRFTGTWLSARLGYSSENAGSSKDAWHYFAGYSKGLITTKQTSLIVNARLNGRYEGGEAADASLSAIARYHRRWTDNQLFYAAVSGTYGKNLDIDDPLYLGGETGLRGYPLRYQNGEQKALVTLEHRLYTDWYPFRLFHVGGAVFFDAGRMWGDSPVNAQNLGLLKDVGFGLRLGNTRSGNGKVLHIDIAFPLDGGDDIDSVQILIDARSSF